MTADFFTSFFSPVCGQGRCFEVGGAALPVCQRCLGLYVGAAITGAYWIFTRGWRRGLPGRRVLAVHIVLLAAAMLGGVHVLDFDPRWRFLCGLWTGHVIILWLAGASEELRHRNFCGTFRLFPWGRKDTILVFILLGGISALPWLFDAIRSWGRVFWGSVALAGFLMSGTAFFYAIILLVCQSKNAYFSKAA